MLKRFLHVLNETFSTNAILKVIGILLILFLLKMTQAYWGHWFALLKAILQPFLIGFAIAYIMHPLVMFMQRKGIPKNLAIIIIWLVLIVAVALLLFLLMPVLYEKINQFMTSVVDGIFWISKKIKSIGSFENFSLIDSITSSLVGLLDKYDDWVPRIVSTLPNIMSAALDVVTTILFSTIIAIYMLFDFNRVRHTIKRVFLFLCPKCDRYLYAMDENVSVYIKSIIILMLIKLIEYSVFYFFIGHPDWMIIGIITALGAIVPYLGGTIANGIGILTALTLSPSRIVALIVGIVILSNVDAYVISPFVHEKRSSLGPLVTLFSVFAGGILMGPVGIMLSVPVAIIIKTLVSMQHKQRTNDAKADHV